MRVNQAGDKCEIFVDGTIGEKNDIYHFKTKELRELTLDLSEVKSINSIGVKNWILWINKFPPGIKFSLRNCPHVIANQCNFVAGFVPKGSKIESVYVFYNCETCSKEKSVLLKLGEHYKYGTAQAQHEIKCPSDILCEKCNTPLEPDFIPAKLFKFLEYKA